MVSNLKPAPIPIRTNSKIKGYVLQFSFGGTQHKRHLIKHKHIAEIFQSRINTLVIEFKNGLVELPENTTLPDFIFGKAVSKAKKSTSSPSTIYLTNLINEYKNRNKPPAKEESTWKTECIHLRHLQRFVENQGYEDIPICKLNDLKFFDKYKQFRYEQEIKTDTVKKELLTFQMLVDLAIEYKYIEGKNVVKNVKRDKSQVSEERFRTCEEIEEILKHGNYSQKKIKEIKRFRYLTRPEVGELIALAKGSWLCPILVTFGHTGMRRGEMANLEWADIDLKRQFLWVGSKKQSKKQKMTKRRIYFNEELLSVLESKSKKREIIAGCTPILQMNNYQYILYNMLLKL